MLCKSFVFMQFRGFLQVFILKGLRVHSRGATRDLEQAKDYLDGDPGGDGMPGGVTAWCEAPGTNGVPCSFIEAHAESPGYADIGGAAVRTDQHQEGHHALEFGFAGFFSVSGIGAVQATGLARAAIEPDTGLANAPGAVFWSVTHGAAGAVADGVGGAWAGRARVNAHPRQTKLVHRGKQGSGVAIENGRRHGHMR